MQMNGIGVVKMEFFKLTDEEYDALKDQHGNLLQTGKWGIIKHDAWESEVLGIKYSGRTIGYFMSLTRNLGLGRKLVYLARGPILNEWSNDIISELKVALIAYGKRKKAITVKIDPLVIYETFQYGEPHVDGIGKQLLPEFLNNGFIHKGLNMDLSTTIQPRFQAIVEAENYGENHRPKKMKQFVNTAKRRGVFVEMYRGSEANDAIINDFVTILHKTEERQHIHLRNAHYFKLIMETFDTATIYLGKLDLTQQKKLNQAQLAKLENEQSDLLNNQAQMSEKAFKKKENKLKENLISARKEQKVIHEAVEHYGEGVQIISGALTISEGNMSELLYAGMNSEFSYYNPAYLTWDTAVLNSFTHGRKRVNLGGISGSLDDGLIGFKKNFAPTIESYIGEFDLPINRGLYHLFNVAVKVLKKVR
jgi:serine/alanine adding enzyme